MATQCSTWEMDVDRRTINDDGEEKDGTTMQCDDKNMNTKNYYMKKRKKNVESFDW